MINRYYGLIILSIFLCGCGPVNVSQSSQYNLDGISNKKLAKHSSNLTLLVSTPKSASGFDSSDMIYTKKPFQLDSFANNEWVAPPAEMLSSVIIESLQNSGYFRAVVQPSYTASTRFILNTTVLELKQNFLKKPSEVSLTLKVDLIDSKRNVVIASKRFNERRQTKTADPYGGVIAANLATRSLMTSLSSYVVKVCRQNS